MFITEAGIFPFRQSSKTFVSYDFLKFKIGLLVWISNSSKFTMVKFCFSKFWNIVLYRTWMSFDMMFKKLLHITFELYSVLKFCWLLNTINGLQSWSMTLQPCHNMMTLELAHIISPDKIILGDLSYILPYISAGSMALLSYEMWFDACLIDCLINLSM